MLFPLMIFALIFGLGVFIYTVNYIDDAIRHYDTVIIDKVTLDEELSYDDTLLMFAIMKQESSLNKDKRRGDNGQSWGPFQIKLAAVMDVNSYYDTNFAHSDVLEVKTGWWIATLYMDMWANSERLGHPPTIEDRCRVFKGGPRGYKDERTIGWWLDVRQTYISLLSRPRGT